MRNLRHEIGWLDGSRRRDQIDRAGAEVGGQAVDAGRNFGIDRSFCKRHIGNDLVIVIFCDEPNAFNSVDILRSHQNRSVFVFVGVFGGRS